MRKTLSALPIILGLIIILSSCRVQRLEPKIVVCPVPEQNCSPGAWKGIDQDTSVETSKVLGYYYRIEKVLDINSTSDEWGLSFIGGQSAVLTYTDNDRMKMMMVRMAHPNRGNPESGLNVSVEGHRGAVSARKGSLVFAAVPDPDPEMADGYDVYVEEVHDVFNEMSEGFEENYNIGRREEDTRILKYKSPYRDLKGNSRIYTGKLKGSNIIDIAELDNINYDVLSWESQPALSPDGDVMFFVTDRETQTKGTEIWVTSKDKSGNWRKPVNAGEIINSRCDELTPFVTPDGKELLFASTGHETVGGYDLFSVKISQEFWKDSDIGFTDKMIANNNYFSGLKNFRPPVNTPYDELFPSCGLDKDSIFYYSSNQFSADAGGFDIYVRHKIPSPYLSKEKRRTDDINVAFTDPVIKHTEVVPDVPFFNLGGTVYSEVSKEPVPNADVIVKDGDTKEVTQQTKTDDKGVYSVELEKGREFEITAQTEDLFFDSFKLRVEKEDTTTVIKKDFNLPAKLELRINFPFDNWDSPYRFALDSNGNETNRSWEEEITLLADNILLFKDQISKIIIVGHTDLSGSAAYNKTLGKRRVNFIFENLIKRGVPEAMLDVKSAGEDEPLVKREDESKDEYYKRLRRVTLEKVLKN